jgi:TetR/AcrR family transcriptional repressor of nem operon
MTMRVSRIQAAENRETVINVASRLFREHGFDGIGLKDLMKGAGLTQGAFYKQFASKDDLAAQASRRAMASGFNRWSATAAANPDDPFGALIALYLSPEHREERMDGCPVVALGSDAARQGADVKASFEAGIREYLELLGSWVGGAEGEEPSGKAMTILSTMVGAVVLSRAVNDEQLSKQFLQAPVKSLMGLSAGAAQKDSSDDDGLSSRVPRPVENRPSETSSPQKEERVSLDDIARQAQPTLLHPQHGAHHHG